MKTLKTIAFLFLVTFVCSCTKVINVNLKSSTPQFVVEGNITDMPGPYTIKITKSINYDQDNNFPGVTGARVVITDVTAGIMDTLVEAGLGLYNTHLITGVSGHTYTLNIVSGSTVLTSSSTMPAAVPIDSMYTEKSPFGSKLDVVPVYQDPPTRGNYYHLILTVGDSTSGQIHTHSDDIINNNKVISPLFSDIDILSGNSVTVELQCIDHPVYQYYDDLNQTIQQNSASPANPQSNVIGGALGYFSAHTVNRMTIVVP